MALVYIILGILIARLFWRQLLMAAALLVCLAVCVFLLRAAPSIGVAPSWLLTLYGAFAIGIVGGSLLAWRLVVNYLVERDFERDVERARGNADKRKV